MQVVRSLFISRYLFTEKYVDILVNAGNETLDGGGGIYKAIHETEKQRLLTECWELND